LIRVAIADDHPLVREGFGRLLGREPDMQLAGDASTAAELMNILAREACDVVVLDIGLPDRSGLDVLRDVRTRYPRIAVLILSMHPTERYAVRCLQSGAAGYLTKSSASDELVKAIRKVGARGRYISEALAEEIAFHLGAGESSTPHEALSHREYQVFLLLAEGKSTAESARFLGLSDNTIWTYRRRILSKLHLRTNSQLSLYALRQSLVD
jgi:two-component system invasion response regulator UvrY